MMFRGSEEMSASGSVSEVTQDDGGVPCEALRRCAPYRCVPVAHLEGVSIDHQCVEQWDRRLIWDGPLSLCLEWPAIPGAHLLANVTAEDLIPQRGPKFLRDRSTVLDGEVREATPRIQNAR